MLNYDITSLNEKLKNNEINSEELIKQSIKKCHEVQEKTNSFVTIVDEFESISNPKSILNAIPFGAKDNFSTKGILSTGSSNTLKDYIPFFDATVIKKLKESGAVLVGKTVLDELGMGGTGTTGHTGRVLNPWNTKKSTSGSSAGSASSVASGCYPFALGSDTGDSIRKPAAFCGIVGYKPTYGMVSRYGLFPFACSLDTVGVLTRNVKDAAIVINAIKGQDKNDMTTWDSSNIDLTSKLENDVKGKKLFYIKEVLEVINPSEETKEHLNNFYKTIELCKTLGIDVEEVSIDKTLLNALPVIYQVISCAEATSNMANLTGISFGPRGNSNDITEMIKDHRTKGFSPLIKRRFVIGSYVLQSQNQEKYYLNAKRVRRLLVNKMNELFKSYDGLILPVSSGPATDIEDCANVLGKSVNLLEEHMQIANYGGYPSITIPNGFISNLPVGVNITGKVKDDENILNIAYILESNMNYKNQIAKEVE